VITRDWTEWADARGKTEAGKRALYEEHDVWHAPPTDLRTHEQRLSDAMQVYALLGRSK
jgi:hypothetical protein